MHQVLQAWQHSCTAPRPRWSVCAQTFGMPGLANTAQFGTGCKRICSPTGWKTTAAKSNGMLTAYYEPFFNAQRQPDPVSLPCTPPLVGRWRALASASPGCRASKLNRPQRAVAALAGMIVHWTTRSKCSSRTSAVPGRLNMTEPDGRQRQVRAFCRHQRPPLPQRRQMAAGAGAWCAMPRGQASPPGRRPTPAACKRCCGATHAMCSFGKRRWMKSAATLQPPKGRRAPPDRRTLDCRGPAQHSVWHARVALQQRSHRPGTVWCWPKTRAAPLWGPCGDYFMGSEIVGDIAGRTAVICACGCRPKGPRPLASALNPRPHPRAVPARGTTLPITPSQSPGWPKSASAGHSWGVLATSPNLRCHTAQQRGCLVSRKVSAAWRTMVFIQPFAATCSTRWLPSLGARR